MTPDEATKPNPSENRPKHWQRYAVWIGLAIAASNFPLYAYVIRHSPDLRDRPWLNVSYSWLGLVLALIGTWHVFKQRLATLRRGLVTLGLLLTLLLVGLFNWYVFSFSYTLPKSLGATAVGDVAPEFALLDHERGPVSLSDYRGKNVILVFYRGDW